MASKEPAMKKTYKRYILDRSGFGESLSYILADSMDDKLISSDEWREVFMKVYDGHFGAYEDQMGSAEWLGVCDLCAVLERDPACTSLLGPLLHFKGFKVIQAHRISHVMWRNGRQALAMNIQQRISELWGVDCHPAAIIGGGMMIDHATGVVIGSTACVGCGCTFLHNTTLGSTGKEDGERHPKLGNNVMVG